MGLAEKVNFLNHGGDDVLTYPFPMQELLARIQSLSRRPKSYVDNSLYLEIWYWIQVVKVYTKKMKKLK